MISWQVELPVNRITSSLQHTRQWHRYAAGAFCRQGESNVCIPHYRKIFFSTTRPDWHKRILRCHEVPGTLQQLKSSSSRCNSLGERSWYYVIMNVTNTVKIHTGGTKNCPCNVYRRRDCLILWCVKKCWNTHIIVKIKCITFIRIPGHCTNIEGNEKPNQ